MLMTGTMAGKNVASDKFTMCVDTRRTAAAIATPHTNHAKTNTVVPITASLMVSFSFI